jgi:guanyl-specific ribonuclease Sa
MIRRLGVRWLILLPVLLAFWAGSRDRATSSARRDDAPSRSLPPESPAPVTPSSTGPPPPASGPLADPARRAQIEAVIESMDRTGHPPPGVAQGGRKSGGRGVFENAERRLPGQPRGYYEETDVWPRHGPRGAERLVFGRAREVYYTGDHYRTFVKVR